MKACAHIEEHQRNYYVQARKIVLLGFVPYLI